MNTLSIILICIAIIIIALLVMKKMQSPSTFFYKVIDTIPFIRQYAEKTPPLAADTKRFISRFFNQSVFDYKHTGIETYIIVDGILKRVDNATHIFTEPTIYDLLNVANTHMIDYQRWISV